MYKWLRRTKGMENDTYIDISKIYYIVSKIKMELEFSNCEAVDQAGCRSFIHFNTGNRKGRVSIRQEKYTFYTLIR